MSRRAFGRWGAALDRDEFAQALAAAGVGETNAVALKLVASGASDRDLPWSLRDLRPSDDFDPRLLAETWRELLSDRPPSLRLAVHGWPEEVEPAWLLQELGRPAVALDSVYLEAPPRLTGMSWSWPLQIAILDDGHSTLREQLSEHPPWTVQQFAELIEAESPVPCDLLLVPTALRAAVARILPAPIKASVVVLLEPLDEPWRRAHALVDTVLMDTEAGAVVFAPVGRDPGAWLHVVLEKLAHDAGLDAAVLAAARELDLPPPTVLAEKRLLVETRMSQVRERMVRRMRTGAAMANGGGAPAETMARRVESTSPVDEAGAAGDLAEISREARDILPPAQPRYLQARVLEAGDEDGRQPVRALKPSTLHEVKVQVGPPDAAWLSGDIVFPDEELPRAEEHRLTVVLTEPYLLDEPQIDEILLPSSGASTTCSFWLQAPEDEGPLQARIIILHEGRVLQTALLTGEITAGEVDDDRAIDVEIEALLHPAADLAGRTRFDAAFVVNHDRAEVPRVTLIAGQYVDISEPQDIQQELDKIAARLEALVIKEQKTTLEDEDIRLLLVFLANHGSSIYRTLLDRRGAPLSGTERLQIVSAHPEAFLPLEFVYDRKAPLGDAKLCPNAKTSLAEGKCDGCPSLTDPSYVCPMGFWCLSKIIERQLHDPDRPPEIESGYRVQSAPTSTRKRLGELTSVLFAASTQVDEFKKGTTAAVVKRLKVAVGSKPTQAKTWTDWAKRVGKSNPPLLVVLPHTVEDEQLAMSALEIGKGQQLGVSHIESAHVGGTSPIVVLLGCNTGETTIPFQQFPTAFRQCGAAIVLGTHTKVLGRNAGPVAAELVASLVERAKKSDTTFGEVMRDVRRSLLAQGMSTVLAVTAYGDADWILGPNGG